MRQPKILFFDIETSPLKAWLWQTGKQYVNFKQLDKDYCQYKIICLAYCWNDGKPAKSLDWGYDDQNSAELISEFDEIVRSADHIIGKNSDAFDIKMVNAIRMLSGLPGFPDWMLSRDDLEKQMRKYFRLPSQSLDYISQQLGFGGKIKMEFNDWINICEKNKKGRAAFNKMVKYCKKDVEDTRAIWYKLIEHFEPNFNMSTFKNAYNDSSYIKYCRYEDCGSENLRQKKDCTTARSSVYVKYICRDCGRYAGMTTFSKNGREGKIR